MTTLVPAHHALHGPRRAALEGLQRDVALVQSATRRVLLALLELDDLALAQPAATGLGTRRHVLARLGRHSDRTSARLRGGPQHVPDDALLRAPLATVVDRITTALGSTLDAIATAPVTDLPAAAATIADHLAWLELTLVDLDAGSAISTIPDAALDAVATHFAGEPNSPFAALVAA